MKFDGIDWTELSKYFGIIDEAYEGGNDEVVIEKTKKYLYSVLHTEKEKETADAVREFLQKLYKNTLGFKESSHVWKGLLAMEHEFNLLKYSIALLPFMSF